MRVKVRPPRTRLKDNKLITTKISYKLIDCDGEVLRVCEAPFPNGVKTKEDVVLLDFDKIEKALF